MKKILASMLSIALLASSFVVAFAVEGDPIGEVSSIKELTKEQYETVMADHDGQTLEDGETAYEISIDLKNLPDLKRGGATGTSGGVRIGNSEVSLYVDKPENVSYAIQMDASMKDDFDLSAEKFSPMKYTSEMNQLDGKIVSLFQPGTAPAACFPQKTAQETLDVDGVLKDAFVVYVVTSGPVTITSIKSDITIVTNGDIVNGVLTKNTQVVNIPIGESSGSTTETKTFAATITSSAKPLAADTLRFLFDVTEDGVVKVKGYDLALGVDFDTNATINAALQVKDIDTSKVTSFAFKSVAWAE